MNRNPQSPQFLAGAAQIEITPQPGIDLTGYIHRAGPSTGVHDALFATALVFQDGKQSAALLSCDLVGLDGPTVASVRQKIQAAVGIPAENVMLACTHTHSGPATIFVQDCGQVDPAYLAVLEAKLVEVVRKAASATRPVQVGVGAGELHGWAYDRRKQGTPIDPQVGVIGLRDLAGQPLAVLANYACHPVVLEPDNRLISADYPGAFKQAMQEKLGVPAVFLTGAPGDVDPVQRGSFAAAQAFGQALAGEALRVLEGMQFSPIAPLAVGSLSLDLPLDEPPAEEALCEAVSVYGQRQTEASRNGQPLDARVHGAMLHWAVRTLERVRQGQAEASVACEVQALRLGQAAVVGVAGELFSELGQAIKRGSQEEQRIVLVSAYTNGDIGYIPTPDAYAQGGYEVVEAYRYYGYPAVLRVEAGERIVEGARRVVEEVFSDQ